MSGFAIEGGTLRAAAGTLLRDVREALRGSGLFLPPDPTEWTATLGGMAATDASGSDGFRYGSTRDWVEALDLVLPDGSPVAVVRGEHTFGEDGRCRHPLIGELEIRPPVRTLAKDAAGYRMRPRMDLVDLVLGSEGTLCLVAGVTMRLAPEPAHVLEAVLFPGSGELLWPAVRTSVEALTGLRAVEMMDGGCLELVGSGPGGVPVPPGAACAVILRMEALDADGLDACLSGLAGLAGRLGIPDSMTWVGVDEGDGSRIRAFRHSLPETVNREIASLRTHIPGIHKLASDTAVPPDGVEEHHAGIRSVMEREGLRSIVFGHAGQGHLHANVIPRSRDELSRAESCMDEIAAMAAAAGGTVTAEHGLGRLKGRLLGLMHDDGVLACMSALRRSFDPDRILNRSVTWA
jgi:D-lactate dehydrogenase (cytochrome)